MERTKLGTSDIEVTPIIMGTRQAGKAMWAGIEDAQNHEGLECFD